MELVEQSDDSVTILEVKGNIDSDSSKEFARKLTHLIQSGCTRLIVDLRHAAYMTSSGVRALFIAFDMIGRNQGKLAVCGLTSTIERLFEIANLNELLEIYPTREQALVKLKRPGPQ